MVVKGHQYLEYQSLKFTAPNTEVFHIFTHITHPQCFSTAETLGSVLVLHCHNLNIGKLYRNAPQEGGKKRMPYSNALRNATFALI
jgi:hypothetical protein